MTTESDTKPDTKTGDDPQQNGSSGAAVREPATQDSENRTDANPNKGGAPPGNQNAMRHGLRSGMLPKGAEHVQRQCSAFRLAIEGAVVELDGGISVYQAALIQSAVSHLRHALLCRKWLRDSFGALSHIERLTYSREITRALDSRDRVLKSLNLDQEQRDAVTILYANEGADE